MKYKSTLALLVLVVAAGLIAYALSRKPTSQELAEQQRQVLPGLNADDVIAIEIERGETKIACERTGKDEWTITEPVRLRTDKFEVDALLSKFVEAERVGRATMPEEGKPLSLADKGLDKPSRKVTFRSGGVEPRSWSIAFGDEVGVGDLVFAKPADREVVLRVKSDVAKKLDVTLNDLRSKKLCEEMEPDDLTALRIEAAKWEDAEAFALAAEKKDAAWELSEPIRDPGDGNKMAQLVRKINDHYVSKTDFVTDDATKAAEYGLDAPALTVTFTFGETEHTFIVGHKKQDDADKFYAMNKAEPAIVEITKTLFDDLRKQPDEVRDRSLLTFARENVKKIAITQGDASLVLDKQEGSWQIAGETPTPADGAAVTALLDGLESAEVKEFAAYDPEKLDVYGLADAQVCKVELKGGADETLAALELGEWKDDADTTHVRRPGYAAVLSLGVKDYLRDVRRGRLSFLGRQLLTESQDEAVAVALAFDGKKYRCTRADKDAEWKLAEPVEGDADAGALRRLVFLLSQLKAKGIAAESAADLKPYGLDKPQVQLAVTYREPEPPKPPEEKPAEGEKPEEKPAPKPRVHRLLLGAESKQYPEGVFAMLAGEPRVFILSKNVLDMVRVNPASRLISRADKVEKLTFTWPGKSLVAVREEDVWKTPDGKELGTDARRNVKAVATLLEYCTAHEVAALAEKDPTAYGFDKPALTIEFKDAAAEGKKLVIGKELEDGTRYVKGPASSYVLVARKWDADKLLAITKEPEKPKEPAEKPAPEPAE